jgi:hypothetical protein
MRNMQWHPVSVHPFYLFLFKCIGSNVLSNFENNFDLKDLLILTPEHLHRPRDEFSA